MTTTKWTRIRTEHLSINARTDVSTKGKQKIMTIGSSNTTVFQLSALVFRWMKSLMPTLHIYMCFKPIGIGFFLTIFCYDK
jgi:hypothetical protein